MLENMYKIRYNDKEVHIMTKEDIYNKLEFSGKYDTKIKTNLRNLIKENKESKELLPLLLEVQNELETGKAKTIYNRMLKNDGKEAVEPKKEEKKPSNNKKKYTPKEKKEKEENKKKTTDKVKKESNKKKPKKKKKGNIIAKIFIILFAILMIASSVSTIFTYFR